MPLPPGARRRRRSASRRSRSRRRRRRRRCGRSAPAPPASGGGSRASPRPAVKSSPAAPWTRARLSKLSLGPSTAFSTPSSRASTEPLMTTCSASEALPARQDGLARPEIADVERGAELLDLLLAQAVEGRVVGVEAALHGGRDGGRGRGRDGPARAAPARQWHVRRGGADAGLRPHVLRVVGGDLARAPAGWRRPWTPARCRRRRWPWRTAPGCRRGTAPPGSRRSAPRPPC